MVIASPARALVQDGAGLDVMPRHEALCALPGMFLAADAAALNFSSL
jgi:hypothetical protein